MSKSVIAIASDHAGVNLKAVLAQDAREHGYEIVDLGTQGAAPVDYPDYAHKLAEWMKQNPQGQGVLICGSGIGMSIAANRHTHVRAVLATSGLAAQLARKHNDANVICFGARLTGEEMAKFCLRQFLDTAFEGGRHQQRVDKLSK